MFSRRVRQHDPDTLVRGTEFLIRFPNACPDLLTDILEEAVRFFLTVQRLKLFEIMHMQQQKNKRIAIALRSLDFF